MLWNAREYVSYFNFRRAHFADSVNTTVDFLSKPKLRVMKRIRLKIREDIQTIPIEVAASSLDVANKEQLLFTQLENEIE